MSKENGKSTPQSRPGWFKSLFSLRFFSESGDRISKLAVIEEGAEIADDVEIGPFCVIGPKVKIGQGCRLLNSVTILGNTTLGRDNICFPHVVLGASPQDKKFRGEDTLLEIGNANVFREQVTLHIGTTKGGGVTRMGDNNMLMVNSHIGHDVQFGSHCILANNCMVAGHVIVGDYVNMMGAVGVHHKVTVGEYAFIGGASRIHFDVPPFVKVDGADEIRGLNKVGLRRSGNFTDEDIAQLDRATRALFYAKKRKTVAESLREFEADENLNPAVKRLVEFMKRRTSGKHGRYLDGLF